MTALMLNEDFIGTRLMSLLRPDLEHHCALDFCASRIGHGNEPAIIMASTALLAHEMLKRLAYREVAVLGRGDWDERVLQSSLLHRSTSATPFKVFKIGRLKLTSPGVMWAEPINQDTVQTVVEISKHVSPGGRLYVMTTGRIARFQSSTKTNPHSTLGAAGLIRTSHLLQQAGLEIEEVVGFHTPISILWGVGSRLMARANRADSADRLLVRMRESFVATGRAARYATVNVVVARSAGASV
jgi:hypothetical protein